MDSSLLLSPGKVFLGLLDKRFSLASKRRLISLTSSRSFFGSCSTAARSQSAIHVSPLCIFSCRAALNSERIGSIWPLSVVARALAHKSWIRLPGSIPMTTVRCRIVAIFACCKSCKLKPAAHQFVRGGFLFHWGTSRTSQRPSNLAAD